MASANRGKATKQQRCSIRTDRSSSLESLESDELEEDRELDRDRLRRDRFFLLSLLSLQRRSRSRSRLRLREREDLRERSASLRVDELRSRLRLRLRLRGRSDRSRDEDEEAAAAVADCVSATRDAASADSLMLRRAPAPIEPPIVSRESSPRCDESSARRRNSTHRAGCEHALRDNRALPSRC